jgi:hypothetical protein
LDSSESTLLACLNNGTTYWAGQHQTYDVPKISLFENSFFDKMKSVYCEYIDLNKLITQFLLQTQPMVEPIITAGVPTPSRLK